ncbi:MAG TPA: hypothetical protein VKY31_10075 [Terriglobia bacterium]|nr:hypothetical protein [Terriglobia bacterium]
MKRLVACSLMILMFAFVVAAHGDPLLGTVTAVGKDTVTIKDKAGKSVVVMLEKNTKFLMNKKPATIADLKVGSRVSIDAHMEEKMKMYSAEEVEIGTPAAAK